MAEEEKSHDIEPCGHEACFAKDEYYNNFMQLHMIDKY